MRSLKIAPLGLVLCLLSVLLLTGCPAPLTKTYEPKPSIPEGKSLVYIYRLARGYDTGLKYYPVKANGVTVARMYAGGYVPYVCNPGRIKFTSRTEQTATLIADIEAGQTYYLKFYVATGNQVGTPAFEMVSPQTGTAELSECKLIEEKKEAGYE